MASQQVELQRADVRVRDGDVRKLPETRLDAVRERALRDDLLEGATARVDALCGGRGEPPGLAFAGVGDHVIEVEGPAVDRTHGDRRSIPVPRYSSGAHLLRTNLTRPPVLKRSRRAKETRRGSRPGTAMEVRSLRGRGLDGFDGGCPSPRILLPPPGSREGLRWRMPDVCGTEIDAASCRAQLRTRRRPVSFSRPLRAPSTFGRHSVLSGELGRDPGPPPSSEGHGPRTARRVPPAAFLPTRIQVHLPTRSPRSRRDLDVDQRDPVPKGVKRLWSFGSQSMQIVFLGTSGSWPTPKRNVSAVAVKRGPEIVLVDCGEGTQRQFMLSRLSFMQVSRVFLSHFHGDHFLGLPGMIQSMSMNRREVPLELYAPRGVERLVTELLSLGYFAPAFPVRPQ